MSRPELTSAAWALWLGFRPVVVMVTACALIQVGCLVWIDNCVAVIPDDDPRTVVTIQLVKGFESGGVRVPQIKAVGQDFDCFSAQALVHGNGDQDDNREEYFIPMAGALGQFGLWSVSANYNQSRQMFFSAAVSKVRTEPKPKPRPTSFTQRRLAVAYKDFGHLKVISAEGVIIGKIRISST